VEEAVVQKYKTTKIIQGNPIQGNLKNKGEVQYLVVVVVEALIPEKGSTT
jgi:hypothetical protein